MIRWPELWQSEARAALTPYFGADARVDIIYGPNSGIGGGTRSGGFVYLVDDVPTVIFDHSGRPDVYPWPLMRGPVMRIDELRPGRRPVTLFVDAEWGAIETVLNDQRRRYDLARVPNIYVLERVRETLRAGDITGDDAVSQAYRLYLRSPHLHAHPTRPLSDYLPDAGDGEDTRPA